MLCQKQPIPFAMWIGTLALSSVAIAHADLISIGTDPITVDVTIKQGNTTGILDTGATSDPNSIVPGSDNVPVPASSVSRDTAQSLGLLNKDGDLVDSRFEKDTSRRRDSRAAGPPPLEIAVPARAAHPASRADLPTP